MKRLFIASILLASPAHAEVPVEPEQRVDVVARPSPLRDRISIGFDSGVRARSDGKSLLGAGIVARFIDGDYSAALSLSRWQATDDHDPNGEKSWQLGVRGYRHFPLGGKVRGHVMAGLNYEKLTVNGAGHTAVEAQVGAGASYKIT